MDMFEQKFEEQKRQEAPLAARMRLKLNNKLL